MFIYLCTKISHTFIKRNVNEEFFRIIKTVIRLVLVYYTYLYILKIFKEKDIFLVIIKNNNNGGGDGNDNVLIMVEFGRLCKSIFHVLLHLIQDRYSYYHS